MAACLLTGIAFMPLTAHAQFDEASPSLQESVGAASVLDRAQDLAGEIQVQEETVIQNLLPESEIQTEQEAAVDLESPLPEQETPVMQEVAEPAVQPEAQDLSPVSSGVADVPDMPAAQEGGQGEFNEDLFFDAEALVPTSDLSRQGAPSTVNPATSPGSRLIVTRKQANPGSKEARLIAAERATRLGRYESALEIYEGLYVSNKRDPNILLGRATALQRAGYDDEAIAAYEELLEIRPHNVEAQINLQGLMSKRYPAVALRNLKDLNEDQPGNSAVIAQLAVVEAQLGHYAEAIRYLGVAASMEPNNANHVFNMAVIADRAGDKKQAIRFYEEALEVDTLYGAGKTIPRETVFERLAQLR
ncbi:MAG: tetratricopeptide repeat protein [Rhodospirillales bacterium]|nr:tetratricopeptide repeat protein [Rhodospirillales bacterium]